VFIAANDDGSGGDNWSYTSCKAPVKSSATTNQFFHRPNVLPVAQPTNATLDIKSNNLCDTICLLPLQVDNIFLFIEQVAPVPAC